MNLHDLSAVELGDRLARKELSSEEVVRSALDRIEAAEPEIHAFIAVTGDEALAEARAVDESRRSGETLGSLAGIPIAVKDNICTRALPTTCASRILENFIAPYDATVIDRLKADRLVIVGKTNMDEFAMGSSTEHSSFGATANPWDVSRVPGGSSGGSAAAVAAREVPLALGTDTGGSVRQPAALTGVVGLKPTYGRVSRYGLVAYASSLDQIGPLARDTRDCARLMRVISGHDPRDATSAGEPSSSPDADLENDVKGLRIGIPKEYFVPALDREVDGAVRDALRVLEAEGAVCEEVEIPHLEYAIEAYYVLASAEASSNLARYDGVKYGYRGQGARDLGEMYRRTRSEGFGDEVKRRIMLGTFVLSSGYYDEYYGKAQKTRQLVERDFSCVFERVDIIAGPTSPTAAFRLGEKIDDPIAMYLSDIYTISANLAGIPGLSVPCGFTSDGLPIGLQLLGKPFDEASILRAGFVYEQSTDWHTRKPMLAADKPADRSPGN